MESVKSNPSVLDEPNYDSFDLVEYEDANDQPADMESDALKVMFHGIKSTYRFGEPITVRFYTFNERLAMEDGDRVGIAPLKRSPFMSQKISNAQADSGHDIISEDFIEESQITSKKLNFVVDQLPEEIKGERFFQFCYLNSEAQTVGLSIPFQFLASNQSSPAPEVEEAAQQSVMEIDVSDKGLQDEVHCERQEDDDFIVVRTTDNFLKERVQHLTRNNNLIQSLVRNLQTELAMKIQENSNLTAEMQKVEAQALAHKSQFDLLAVSSAGDRENIRKSYELTIDGLKNTIVANGDRIAQLEATIQEQKEELARLTSEIEGVRMVVPESEAKDKKIADLSQALQSAQQSMNQYRDKREIEIIDLEETLRKSMDNLKNMNLKYENAQANSAAVERDLRAKLKNEQDRVQLLVAKLEQARIEYSAAQNRTLYFKNKTFTLKHEIAELKKTDKVPVAVQTTTTTAATLPSAPPLSSAAAGAPTTEITIMESEPIRDEVDSRFDALEREEMEIQAQQARAGSSRQSSAPKFRTSDQPSTSGQQQQQLSQLQQIFAMEREQREQRQKDHKPATAAARRSQQHQQQPMEEIIIEDEILEPLGPRAPIEPAFQTIPKSIPREIPIHVVGRDGPSRLRSIPIEIVASAPPAQQMEEDYNVVLPCIFCNQSIQCRQHGDGSGQMREMIEHLEAVHNQKMCPICSTLFDMNLPVYKSYFHNHVNEHLKNATYPELER